MSWPVMQCFYSFLSTFSIYYCCFIAMDQFIKLQFNLSTVSEERRKMASAKVETLKLSIFFVLLLTAFTANLMIITYVYEQQGLDAIGPTSLCITYVCLYLSSVMAASVRWKYKYQMICSAIAYTAYLSTGFIVPYFDETYLKYLIVSIGSAVCGLSGGFLWLSQGKHMHLLCQQHQIEKDKGKYFGLLSSIMAASHILAGLIVGFGLSEFKTNEFFMMLTGISGLSIIYGIIFLTDLQKDEIKPIEQKQETIKERIKKIFKFYPNMVPIIPMFMIYGLSLGIYTSEIDRFLPSHIKKEDLNDYTRFCTLALGLGATLGGYFSGYFGDKLTVKNSGRFGVSIYIFTLLLTVATLQLEEFWMTLVVSFFWGFTNSYAFSWVMLTCSRNYSGAFEAFSITRQVQNLTFSAFQILVIVTDNEINLYILSGALAFIALPAVILLNKADKKQEVKQQTQKVKKSEEDEIEKPLLD